MKEVVVEMKPSQGRKAEVALKVIHMRVQGEPKQIKGGDLLAALFSGKKPELEHEVAQKGGATLVAQIDYPGQFISVGYAVCNSNDVYNRKIGRQMAEDRLALNVEKAENFSFGVDIPTVVEMAKRMMVEQDIDSMFTKSFVSKIEFTDLNENLVMKIVHDLMRAHHERNHVEPYAKRRHDSKCACMKH